MQSPCGDRVSLEVKPLSKHPKNNLSVPVLSVIVVTFLFLPPCPLIFFHPDFQNTKAKGCAFGQWRWIPDLRLLRALVRYDDEEEGL